MRSVSCNRCGRRKWVFRLIDAQHPSTWELDVCQPSPALVFDAFFEDNSFLLEVCHGRVEVVTHQEELVPEFVAGMKGNLRRGEAEDQPAAASVDRSESKDLVDEVAIRLGVLAVHDQVRSTD